jgi:hypothetical protein
MLIQPNYSLAVITLLVTILDSPSLADSVTHSASTSDSITARSSEPNHSPIRDSSLEIAILKIFTIASPSADG